MTTETVKVLGSWASPYVMRPRIALNIKSVSYEFLEETFGTKSELLLKYNPIYKKIPVLVHGEKPVCESLIIVQYVDDVWGSGPAILPSDPYDRAIARFWATYIDDKFFPAMRGVGAAPDEEAKKAAINQFEEILVVLENAFHSCSKGNKFFSGNNQIGFLDIALGSLLAWVKVTEIFNGVTFLDEAKIPGLAKWAENFCDDSAVKDVMPSTEKLAEFAKMLFAKMKPQS